MAEIAPRVRLRVKLEEATSAAEAYSNDERKRLTAKRRTWKRVSGSRRLYEKRMLGRASRPSTRRSKRCASRHLNCREERICRWLDKQDPASMKAKRSSLVAACGDRAAGQREAGREEAVKRTALAKIATEAQAALFN